MNVRELLRTYELRANATYPRGTVKRRLSSIKRFLLFCEDNRIKADLYSLNKWIDHLVEAGFSPGTIRNYFFDVISFFDIMMMKYDEKLLEGIRKRLPRMDIGAVDYLTMDEIRRFFSVIDDETYRLIFGMMYAYARRLGEVLALSWKNIDLKNRIITFPILKKRQKVLSPPYRLEDWMVPILEVMDRKDPVFDISKRACQKAFKKYIERAGIEPKGRRLTPHILRHSRATHLRSLGVDLDFVSKYLLLHASYETTVNFYRGITEEEVQSLPPAYDVIFGGGK